MRHAVLLVSSDAFLLPILSTFGAMFSELGVSDWIRWQWDSLPVSIAHDIGELVR
jgi:hypothetical protein